MDYEVKGFRHQHLDSNSKPFLNGYKIWSKKVKQQILIFNSLPNAKILTLTKLKAFADDKNTVKPSFYSQTWVRDHLY